MIEVMLVGWLDRMFPKQVPGDFELDKQADTRRVEKFLSSKKNCFEVFHQL